MNIFEEQISSSPWTEDWFTDRCNKLKIVMSYLEVGNYTVYRAFFSETSWQQIIFFKVFDELYLWCDGMIDGYHESAQLERIRNRYMSSVLYSNVSGAPSMAPMVFHLIERGVFKEYNGSLFEK